MKLLTRASDGQLYPSLSYVDGATAQNLNLTYANGNTFILRSDFTTTLNPSGPGRNSVRLSSNKQYGNSLLIADIRHMPQGLCFLLRTRSTSR